MSRNPPAPAGRRELVVLGLLTLLALTLRAWRPETFGIDHFDEGA